jgi:arylsulfatase A-like enzyme
LYEGGILEPFIAWWPGKIPSGQVSSMPAAMYDLMPTFAEASNAAKPKTTDGRSILPTLMNRKQEPADFLYWDFYEGERNPKQAIRQGDWKLIRFNFTNPEIQKIELYNLKNYPGELHNLVAENPKIVQELVAIMDQQHTAYPNEGKYKK